jgi:hypothetical protein
MAIWDWYFDCLSEFRAAEDEERLWMAHLHDQGFTLQETDPDGALAAFAEGRAIAARLNEPWWVLFYDVWRVIGLLAYKQDFRDVLDLAVHCAVEIRKPQYAGHPWRFATYNNLVNAYIGIDPLGYEEAIRQALDYLDAEVPPGPNDDRYVMLGKKRIFLREIGRWDEAYRVALGHLDLVASDPDDTGWYAVSVSADLCWLCWRRGDWDGVAAYAVATEEVTRRVQQSQEELAEAMLWQAVLARRAGDEEAGRRLRRRAAACVGRLGAPPSVEYFDGLALYHELGDSLTAALKVRERELETVSGRGRLAAECRAHVKRCRLLGRLGRLRDEDLDAARAAAARLRRPQTYLAEIDEIAGS